ncbi:MAG: alanine--tRNA ligase [Tindallia sp. MSAO_Bac2]|nr:MAG: alanine--tRNA ligase [Tindallia sp. MSAO_Bac2]
MEKKGINEIRKAFLDFFESKDHLVRPSFSLIPQDDNSLLLINSGMAPLKPFFSGTKVPPHKRMATSQKCIRTGDIENVGKTSRHATFFEMMGNFSFGDYFKKEAIRWSWEFSREYLQMPEEKIWASVYLEDDEAYDLWKDDIGVPEERIVRLGKEDNFWEIGLGPCGPCSELYYDRGAGFGCDDPDCKPGCDCDRFVEYWNLVFTQFNKDEEGNYTPLPNPNIDTGMGLERVACILQDVDSIFEIDGMKVILDEASHVTGVDYGKDSETDISLRIITDHIRSVTFMISDGILPSNEGRGYVLRRLLRRASRHGKLLGLEKAFLFELMEKVVDKFHQGYPELEEKKEMIKKVILVEEDRFGETIHQGTEILNGMIRDLKAENKTTLSGDQAFRLYDTYGFPLDLTKEILEEEGLTVNEDDFKEQMNIQKERARTARSQSGVEGWKEDPLAILETIPETSFIGYETLQSKSTVKALIEGEAQVKEAPVSVDTPFLVILDKTPFYSESGGQVGDQGILRAGDFIGRVLDTRQGANDVIYHLVQGEKGSIKEGDEVSAIVTSYRRNQTARNHTATHLLHRALRNILGEHVHQAGSLVTPERLRFDFNHFQPVTAEELETIERVVNEQIHNALQVQVLETSMQEAKELGAEALFGEKYGDKVRVIKTGDFSLELCGGTHVHNSSEIGMLLITSESGIASGVRRIEAVTGSGAYHQVLKQKETLKETEALLKTKQDRIPARIKDLMKDMKEQEKTIQQLKKEQQKDKQGDLLANAEKIAETSVVVEVMEGMNMDELRQLGDRLRDSSASAVIVLAAPGEGKVQFMVTLTKDLKDKGLHAGNIAKEAAQITGGGGGGRPDMAQAGGKDPSKLPEAMETVQATIRKALESNS